MKKNKLWIVLLIVLLFVPTYIAIANYISVNKKPVTSDSATEIVISDIVGITYTERSDSEIAKLFETINANAIKLQSPPDILSGASYFKVAYTEGKRSTEYRYFFSMNTSAVYYLDPDGVSYMVREEDAAAFLETKYAQSLYAEAYLPTLQNGENVLVPASYEWAYKTASGENAVRSTLAATTEDTVSYVGKSGLEFSFSREPETFTVTVKSAVGELLYDGDYAGLAGAVDTKKHTALSIEATAEWLGNEEHLSSGTANYKFLLTIEAKTEFFLALSAENASEGNSYLAFEPGDVAMITAISVKEPQKISFTATPTLTHDGKPITPKFYADGNNAYAFLPTAYDTEPGEYKITLGYEGINYELSFTIAEKKFGNNVYDVTKATVDATRTTETLATYASVVKQIISGDFSTMYLDNSTFGTGVSQSSETGYSVKAGYGRNQTIKSTKETFRLDGVEYYAKDGADIYAVMHGKVLYTSTTAYSGTMIAIDHGYGLISWYHNLGEVSVKVGDIVQKGDVIGKAGSTGFTKGGTAYIGLSVFDVPVCAYDFIWGAPVAFK